MVHDWNITSRPSLGVNRQASRVEVDSRADVHFYVNYRREAGPFSDQPTTSSFDFEPDQDLEINIEAAASAGMRVSYYVIEYTEQDRRAHSYATSPFVHRVSEDTKQVTLAVRAQGRGHMNLGEVTIAPLSRADDWRTSLKVTAGETLTFEADAFAVDSVPSGAVLVNIAFEDAEGAAVLPAGDSPMNPTIGAYKYLECGTKNESRTTRFEVEVPKGATTAKLSTIRWKQGDVYFSQEPEVNVSRRNPTLARETVEDFVARIPENDTLIVLYTTAPQLGHPTLALRPNRLSKEYLKLGCWVVFFPFSRVPVGEEAQGPRARQYSREAMGRFLSAASRRRGANNVFICSSFPDIVAVGAVDLLRLHSWTTVYEVRDDMEEFNRVGYSKWFHPQLETRVAREVDQVVTVSPRLATKMDILRNSPGHSVVVPNAVDGDFILECEMNRSAPSFERRSSSTTVGYIGHLTPSWFDWPLLIGCAVQLPHLTFDIIGHGMPEDLSLPENVRVLGPKTHAEFKEIAQDWKVGIIPFKPSTLTYAVDPNKVYEYLSVGLRTVTARMGSVDLCPSTWIYDDREGFAASLTEAMADPYTPEEAARMEEFLQTATWGARAETMLQLIRGNRA